MNEKTTDRGETSTVPMDEIWLMVRGRVVRLGKPLGWAVVFALSGVGGGIVWSLWRIGSVLLRLCGIMEVR